MTSHDDHSHLPEIAIRPLLSDDTPGIVALYDRAMSVEANIGPVKSADWERFLRLPQNRGGRDFLVASHNDHIVAVAESSLRYQGERRVRFFKIVVDPGFRCRGIGSRILSMLVDLDAAGAGFFYHAQFPSNWTSGTSFLSNRGFSVIEADINMRCRTEPISPGYPPANIEIRRLDDRRDGAEQLACIHTAAYRNDASFRPHDADEILELYADGEIWVAIQASRIIAFCVVELESDRVWLESLAVTPEVQGQGIGSALAYHALTESGVGPSRPSGLNVSSVNPAAMNVYRRLGFSETSRKQRFAASREVVLDRLGGVSR